LRKSIIFPQACFPAVSFSRRRLCTRLLRNRTRSGTPIAQSERSVPGTSSDGTGEARRTSYRPGAPGPLPVSAVSVCWQARHSLEALGRCNVAPSPMPRSAQWIVHNTNHWGAVRPSTGQDQGSNVDRSCQVRPKWDDDPPATWLRTSGSSKTFPPIV
jgi:hypothetical protein